MDVEDDMLVATATVRLAMPLDLEDDEVLIKDYAENAGVLEVLVGAGVVKPPHDTVFNGLVHVHRCWLTRRWVRRCSDYVDLTARTR